MRLLLIEDDPTVTKSIELMLTSEDIEVQTTELGQDGLDLGSVFLYDLILLDLNLPDMSGYEVLRSLRLGNIKTPVLILSGLDGTEHKVKGLGLGADDYLTKPFQSDELIARIRAILRRSGDRVESVIRCGDLTLKLDQKRAEMGRRDVGLTTKEYRMLELLAMRQGTPITKDMFLSHLFRPQPEKVLIVGLGGGSMVHFLNRYDPSVEVDAVEIDPDVVRIADEYFGTRNRKKETDKVQVNIFTADGVDFLNRTESRYDVIYLDAFLKPAADNDATGVPLRLRTREFYKRVQTKLKPDGLVVFNLHTHAQSDEDLSAIRDSFAQVYVFAVPMRSGRVIVASTAAKRLSRTELVEQAKVRDSRPIPGMSYEEMVRGLE